MHSADWIKLFERVPEEQRELLTLMTIVGTEIALQSVVRAEDEYMIVRGRLSGTNDQDRIFIVPYDQIVYAGFTRPIPLATIVRMYDPNAPVIATPAVIAPEPETPSPSEIAPTVVEVPPPPAVEPLTTPPTPPPEPQKPSKMVKATLLERIRARASGKKANAE